MSRIIMIDSVGNEIEGLIDNIQSIPDMDIKQIQCPLDTSQSILISTSKQRIETSVTFDDASVRIYIVFSVFTNFKDFENTTISDVATISVLRGSSQSVFLGSAHMRIVLDSRTELESPSLLGNYSQVLNVGSKQFEDVYSNDSLDGFHTVYFNFDQGILGFRNRLNNTMYTLERIE
jgi:hypothetical protein